MIFLAGVLAAALTGWSASVEALSHLSKTLHFAEAERPPADRNGGS